MSASSIGTDGARLLILDDDALVGNTVRNVAESAGMDVRLTLDADSFFRELDAWQPTHVALDLVMPGMDGMEVMARLAGRNSRARIIVTSGVGERVLEAAGRSAAERGLDIVGVLPKPFRPETLRALLREAPVIARDPTSATVAPGAAADSGFNVDVPGFEHALSHHDLQLAYQPKVCCDSGRVAGFEALVRWQHPVHGTLPPERFVPFAEQHDMVEALTDQVLDLALAWFARLQVVPRLLARTSALSLALNISARTLRDHQFVNRLQASCAAHGIAPERLILELTETSAMDDPVTSLDLLTRLRMKGFQLSLDDFGTGYSSMLQLVRLPFSEIKVDRSFVMSASRSQESRTVIRSIVELCHSLGLRATAEGVEDAEALAYLQTVGCDYAQGYYIARPMAGSAVEDWLARR